jgi:hypothetical protein
LTPSLPPKRKDGPTPSNPPGRNWTGVDSVVLIVRRGIPLAVPRSDCGEFPRRFLSHADQAGLLVATRQLRSACGRRPCSRSNKGEPLGLSNPSGVNLLAAAQFKKALPTAFRAATAAASLKLVEAAVVDGAAASLPRQRCAEGTHTERLTGLKSQGYRQCGFAAITHRYTRQNALCGSMP